MEAVAALAAPQPLPMQPLLLQCPQSSSSYNEHFGAPQAAVPDPTPFCSNPADQAPWWAAGVRCAPQDAAASPFPGGAIVTDVEVCGDLRGAEHGSEQCFQDLVVELTDAEGGAIWRSPCLSCDLDDGAGGRLTERAVVTVPGSRFACGVTVRRQPRQGAPRNLLVLSLVRCFGRPAARLLALARHGLAEHNVGDAFCDGPAARSVVGPALTEEGQRQARTIPAQLARLRLAPAVVLVSPQLRCLESAAQARAADALLRPAPLRLLPEAYEQAWHRHCGGQIPPPEPGSWPAGRERLLADAEVLAAAVEGLPGVPGAAPGGSLAPQEDPAGARLRAGRVLAAMRARPEPLVLLIGHGGLNLDVLGLLEPRWQLFPSCCQRNGEVIVVEMPRE